MNHAKLDNRLADELARLERYERKLARAFRAWERQKLAVKRVGARIDKRMAQLTG
jgi:hypothetical protein